MLTLIPGKPQELQVKIPNYANEIYSRRTQEQSSNESTSTLKVFTLIWGLGIQESHGAQKGRLWGSCTGRSHRRIGNENPLLFLNKAKTFDKNTASVKKYSYGCKKSYISSKGRHIHKRVTFGQVLDGVFCFVLFCYYIRICKQRLVLKMRWSLRLSVGVVSPSKPKQEHLFKMIPVGAYSKCLAEAKNNLHEVKNPQPRLTETTSSVNHQFVHKT